MTDIFKYQCLEIWTSSGKFYKKVYDEEHKKGGFEIEIEPEEFYKINNFF